MLLGFNFYCPEPLVYYTSNTLVNWLTDYSSSQNNQIANAIQSQTDSINAQTNTIQQTQDYLEDDTITNSNMSIDTNYSISQQSDESNFFQTFFQNIYNKYNESTNQYVKTINIPIPFTESNITLRSDLISRPLYIHGIAFYNLIGAFWWFVFARYFINFGRWLIAYITSGKIFGEGGVSQFVNELQNNDVVIKSNMV